MNLAPILLFVYNRPDHTEKMLTALKANKRAEDSELIIYSDAAKNEAAKAGVQAVRKLIHGLRGFKKIQIFEREKNWGLASSIIDGVTSSLAQNERVIVLEDDLITNSHFLEYMNEALEKYQSDERVISIHGFVYPIEGLPDTFFQRGADCWGWATWRRGWQYFNSDGQALLNELEAKSLTQFFDYNGGMNYTQMLRNQIAGNISSWAVRWYASAFLQNKLTLYPGKTLVKNIGFDTGTHYQNDADGPSLGVLSHEKPKLENIQVIHDVKSFEKISRFLKTQKKGLFVRIVNRIMRILNHK